jgi:hypothetical protein
MLRPSTNTAGGNVATVPGDIARRAGKVAHWRFGAE